MSELDEQIAQRKRKLQALAERGVSTYPNRFLHDLEPSGAHTTYGGRSAEELGQEPVRLRVPGRIKALRSFGKMSFFDLSDGRGKLQAMIKREQLPSAAAEVFDHLDLGDYVGAEGTLMRTRTGELTLAVEALVLLAKALRPMPEKWHGLSDLETRYRQRYLDLATNAESRQVFETRAALIAGIRRFLEERAFVEVETPMMQVIPGGAVARPFRTHHNALDLDLYMRIAPELFLKRLLVGGMHRVYEINRNFRNEGISTHHNPEFTMLEFYWAYADYEPLMQLTEEMICGLARALHGEEAVSFDGERLDLSRPWSRLSMREAILRHGKCDPAVIATAASLEAELKRLGADLPAMRDYGHLLLALFEAVAEPHLIQPTFIIDHPVEISPLSKAKPEDPAYTERFELYLGGMEIANGFSELNDPVVQAERFRQQLAARSSGDEEAHRFDQDYITALEHGMPPAAGEGIGIDRLTMIFTDRTSIRDVILFPLLRPLAEE